MRSRNHLSAMHPVNRHSKNPNQERTVAAQNRARRSEKGIGRRWVEWVAVNRGDGVQEQVNAGVVVMCWGGVRTRQWSWCTGRGGRICEAYERTGSCHCLWAVRADTMTFKVGCHSGVWAPGARDSRVPRLPGDGRGLKIGLLRHHIACGGFITS